MADIQDADVEMDDAYDEDADSDFDARSAKSVGSESSSGDEEEDADKAASARAKKRRKIAPATTKDEEPEKLDSGDEATIKEHKKERRKQRKRGEDVDDEDVETSGWRARTRAMRERDEKERKQNTLANIKDSTVDVDKIWAEMNQPVSLRPPQPVESIVAEAQRSTGDADKENLPAPLQEMITVKRTYKFAGEVHTEEKVVPKDSAEAKLWLTQQSSTTKIQALDADGRMIQRPLRKISRFDPNYSNIEAYKGAWTSLSNKTTASGPKLNVVEKSKMDWASHVDTAGLQEELSEAAKAKGSYLSRTDFLREVEQRREEESRTARLRGL